MFTYFILLANLSFLFESNHAVNVVLQLSRAFDSLFSSKIIRCWFLYELQDVLQYDFFHIKGIPVNAMLPALDSNIYRQYIVGWMQERPISAPDWRTTYLGARFKNDLSQCPVQERPISAPDSRTTYLKRDFCFSDFVVTALLDFKIRLL